MYPNRKHIANCFVSDLASGCFSEKRNNHDMENRIKEHRLRLGLSQEQVADRAGTTRATIMKLEKGQMNLTTSWMNRLGKALHCEPMQIMGETPKAPESINEADIAIIYTIKAVLGLLIKQKALSSKDLSESFGHAVELYQAHRLPEAVQIMESLRTFVEGGTHPEKPEELRKLLELVPLGLA